MANAGFCRAAEIIDPRSFAAGTIREACDALPRLSHALPALGYTPVQPRELAAAIKRASLDVVVCATPADLAASIMIASRVARARYDFAEDPTAPPTPLVDAFRPDLTLRSGHTPHGWHRNATRSGVDPPRRTAPPA